MNTSAKKPTTPTKQIILVVDHTPEDIAILCALLRGQYTTRVATNGPDALEIASCTDERPDLILLDIRMPGMDGYEVCRRLKNDENIRDIPVIFLSALNETVDKVKAFSVGGVDYITKPFHTEEVRERVDIQLKVRRLQLKMENQNNILMANNEKLLQLQTLRDEFIGIASHDLRGLLTAIFGYSCLLECESVGAPLTTEAHTWSTIISYQCGMMQKIISDFLDFHAMEDGQFKLDMERVDLNELIRGVVARNEGYAMIKQIAIHLDLHSGALQLVADASRLTQVVENFLSNAIKFCSPGGHVTILTRKTEGSIFMEVRDTGPGLTEEDLKRLFVKYAKLSNKSTGGEKSSGLGLAITHRLIELHGGSIGAKNNPEGGATFWFEIPTDVENSVPTAFADTASK